MKKNKDYIIVYDMGDKWEVKGTRWESSYLK